MPDFCTCGAQLPEDARFCHKCGKPQRDEPLMVEETPAPEPVVAPPPIPEPPAINLKNRFAVRAAMLSSVLVLVLIVLLSPLGLGLLALVIGGFFAAFWYRRRTGQPLSWANGLRLGWIAGIFVFAVTLVIIAITALAVSQPEIATQLREQMLKNSYPAEEVNRLFEMLRSPSGVSLTLLDGFLSSTLLMGIGGAAGAKLLSRD